MKERKASQDQKLVYACMRENKTTEISLVV
jgi:hypothetical protein